MVQGIQNIDCLFIGLRIIQSHDTNLCDQLPVDD